MEATIAESIRASRTYVTGWIVAVAIAALMYLVPSLSGGVADGDLALAQIPGYALVHHESLGSAIGEIARTPENTDGGTFPLAIVRVAFWAREPGPVAARALQIALVVLDVALLAGLVWNVASSGALAALAGVFTLVALQLRKPHDAILGATLQYPLAAAWMLAALLCYARYVRTPHIAFAVLAAVFAAVAALSSGAAFALVVAMPLVWLAARGRGRRALAPVAFVPLVVAATSVVRAGRLPSSLAWLAHPSAADGARAFGALVASLPGSYRGAGFLTKSGLVDGEIDTRYLGIADVDALGLATVFVFFALAMFAVYRLRAAHAAEGARGRSTLYVLAAIFVAIPVVFHDASAWRRGMPLGEADGFAFFGAFGAGLAFALGTSALCRSVGRDRVAHAVQAPAIALGVALLAYGNLRANATVIDASRDTYETFRLVAAAAKAGLFAPLSARSTIAFESIAPLTTDTGDDRNARYLLATATARPFAVTSLRSLDPGGAMCAGPPRRDTCASRGDVWLLRRDRGGLNAGGLDLVRWVATTAHHRTVDRVLTYANAASRAQGRAFVAALRAHGSGLRIGRVRLLPPGAIADISRSCGPVDVEDALKPNEPVVSFGPGFLPGSFFRYYRFVVANSLPTRLDGKDQAWRYARARATLRVRSSGCNGATAVLTAGVFASAPAHLHVRAGRTNLEADVSQSGTTIALTLPRSSGGSIDVDLSTDGPAASEETRLPVFDVRRFPPAYLIVAFPAAFDQIVERTPS